MSATIQYFDPHRPHERRMTMIADLARVAHMTNDLENCGFVVEKTTVRLQTEPNFREDSICDEYF